MLHYSKEDDRQFLSSKFDEYIFNNSNRIFSEYQYKKYLFHRKWAIENNAKDI